MCSSNNSTLKTYYQSDKKTRSVSFGHIHIREYNTELGDNPSCSDGPAITISWKYCDVLSSDVEEFEERRPPRRSNQQMIIPSSTRIDILTEVGYSLKEIIEAVEAINKCKRLRKKSMTSVDDKITNLFQKANRLTLRVKGRRSVQQNNHLNAMPQLVVMKKINV